MGQIWANNRLALSQKRLSVVFDSIWILGEEWIFEVVVPTLF